MFQIPLEIPFFVCGLMRYLANDLQWLTTIHTLKIFLHD